MKVLVLTLSFGSGHVRAAQVIARELSRQPNEAEVRVLDALADSRALFRALYVWPYWLMIRHAPQLWGRFFDARAARLDQNTAPPWAFHWGCPRVFKEIEESAPDVIVAAEVAACEMAAIARRDGLTSARIVSVITDHEAEPVWAKPEVDLCAVADEGVREQLCAWGLPAERIVVSGIPTDASFRKRTDKRSVRLRLGLEDERPIVLLMGGGMGPTRMDEVAARLYESVEPMHIVAITGHDAKMRRRLERLKLERLKQSAPVSLRVLGWTDEVAALMQAAALLVTKPGGLTTAEATLCALPLVMFDAIPGPERRNAARLVRAGAGLMTSGAQETASAVLSLLRDEHLRRRMSARAKQLAAPEAAATIARLIIEQATPARRDARRTTA